MIRRLIQCIEDAPVSGTDLQWLSEQTVELPKIVNVVSTVELARGSQLDMQRVAAPQPNAKYRAKNFASITMRIGTTTGLLSKSCKMVLVGTQGPEEARYWSHVYRGVLENIPMLTKDVTTGEIKLQTLKGKLHFLNWEIQNIVASGHLVQDGVHLMNLLETGEERCTWTPDRFPNLCYTGDLSSGDKFTANIADSAMVNIMGVRSVKDAYEAFLKTKAITSEFQDPNAPKDPKLRFKYRMQQLTRENVLQPNKRKRTSEIEYIPLQGKIKRVKKNKEEEEEEEEGLLGFITGITTPLDAKPVVEKAEKPHEEDPRTLLMIACDTGQVGNVRFLLKSLQPQEILQQDPEGNTAYDRIKNSTNPAHCQITRMLEPYFVSPR